MAGLDVSGFIPDNTPNRGMDLMAQNLERLAQRKQELDYRNKQDKEAQDWKKLNLINDLTDLSKHQTGSDVADAIGQQKMSAIYQKYTQAAGKMSPAELQANIQKDMGGIITSMDATKNELAQADEQAKMLKTQYPSLDINKLLGDYRKEILDRRLDHNTDFKNPIGVGLSQFDITNPEKLADYMTDSDKALRDFVINPTGKQKMEVFKGDKRNNVKYTAEVPFFMKPNFDRSKDEVDGLLQIKGKPQLQIKAHAVPAIDPNQKDGSFMVMDDNVFDTFASDRIMQQHLIKKAKETYGDKYSTFSPDEKKLAQSNLLYNIIKSNNSSDFYSSGINNAPITHNTTNVNTAAPVYDLYGNVKASVDSHGGSYTQFNLLPLDAQTQIVETVNKVRKPGTYDTKLNQENLIAKGNANKGVDIYEVKPDENGQIDATKTGNWKFVGTLSKTGMNIQATPGVKGDQRVVREANNEIHINDIPKGTKLDQKNGKWYYKGKEVLQ